MITFKPVWSALAISLLFTNPAGAQALDLEPFEQWQKSRPRWSADQSEVAYAAVRCGALFGVIGSRFAAADEKPESRLRGQDTIARGMMLTLFGNELAKGTGMSKAFSDRRFDSLMAAYQEKVIQNRSLHNNMFHGYIQGDFIFCNDFERLVKDVAKSVSK